LKQKSIAITAVIAAIMLTAVFTTTPLFSMKDAEGQIIIPIPGRCPVGYERNSSGVCVPIVVPVPDSGDSDETETEQEIGQKNVCSGWAVCTNDAENREDSATGADTTSAAEDT
jgi:hypothetical protein